MDENTFYKKYLAKRMKYYQSKPITELTSEEIDEYLLLRDEVFRMFTEVLTNEQR